MTLGIYLTFSAVSSMGLLIIAWSFKSFDNQSFDNLFFQTSPLNMVLTLLFFAGTLWMISKESFRESFGINKRTMFMTIGIAIVLAVLMFVPFYSN